MCLRLACLCLSNRISISSKTFGVYLQKDWIFLIYCLTYNDLVKIRFSWFSITRWFFWLRFLMSLMPLTWPQAWHCSLLLSTTPQPFHVAHPQHWPHWRSTTGHPSSNLHVCQPHPQGWFCWCKLESSAPCPPSRWSQGPPLSWGAQQLLDEHDLPRLQKPQLLLWPWLKLWYQVILVIFIF